MLSTGECGIDKAHVLHYHCISNWLKKQNRCPVCHLVVNEGTLDLPERDQLPQNAQDLLAYIDQLKRETRLYNVTEDDGLQVVDKAKE